MVVTVRERAGPGQHGVTVTEPPRRPSPLGNSLCAKANRRPTPLAYATGWGSGSDIVCACHLSQWSVSSICSQRDIDLPCQRRQGVQPREKHVPPKRRPMDRSILKTAWTKLATKLAPRLWASPCLRHTGCVWVATGSQFEHVEWGNRQTRLNWHRTSWPNCRGQKATRA
jgi:hypothetical protein